MNIEKKLNDYLTTDEDPEVLFQILEKLGQGTYGSVYKVLNRINGEIVAAKIINVQSDMESMKKEIVILKECQNPYIISYYGSYFKDNSVWIIMEFCDSGSVCDLIRITKLKLNEEQIASIIEMVLMGLAFMHNQKKIHRDIKAGNILLNHDGYAKIADFGVSAQLLDSVSKKTSRIGTPYWMSPEVIARSEYDFSTDIWSLGITCLEIAEGEPPYADIKPVRAMMLIVSNPPKGLRESHWSVQFKDFVSSCLNIVPYNRPTAKMLLKHPFIVSKSKNRSLIAELVSNSLDEIKKYRMENSGDDQIESIESINIVKWEENNIDNRKSDNLYNTVIEKSEYSFNNEILTSSNLNFEKIESIEKKENKFGKIFDDIDINGLSFKTSYGSIKITKDTSDRKISSNIDNNNMKNIPSISTPISLIEKLDIDPPINIDNDNITEIEKKIFQMYIKRDEEINQIKIRYQKHIEKLNSAVDCLKANPGFKNMKQFQKFLKLKNNILNNDNNIGALSSSYFNDISVGGNSIHELNPIKIAEYRQNNIQNLNKNIK